MAVELVASDGMVKMTHQSKHLEDEGLDDFPWLNHQSVCRTHYVSALDHTDHFSQSDEWFHCPLVV